MTKYMKVTKTSGFAVEGELYIDLHKINRIREGFITDHGCRISVPAGSDKALRDYVNDAGYFSTYFSIPGERDMCVFGPAKEFIAHIEEQQKRARKGKEIEPYEPDGTTVYTSAGKVHDVNDLLEPATLLRDRSHRVLSSQTTLDYIWQIIEIEDEVGRQHPLSPYNRPFDHKAVIDLWESATREVEEGTLSMDNYQLIHRAVRPIVKKAVQHQRESPAA